MIRSSPSTRMLPEATGTSPTIAANSVDFPEPFAPTNATWSPVPARNVTSWNSSAPPGSRYEIAFTSTAPTYAR